MSLLDPRLDGVRPLVLGLLRGTHPRSAPTWNKADEWMLGAFAAAGMPATRARVLWAFLKLVMRGLARLGASLETVERWLRPIFVRQTRKLLRPGAERRAGNTVERLRPDLVGESLLDLGAGNGLIAQTVHERVGMRVELADVVDYRLTHLPLRLYPQGGAVPLDDKSVDTTLLYLVLHHADDPDHLLREAQRVTRRRILIMEGYIEDEDTTLCNAFFDWFLNRIIQGADINLPLNYRTIADWHTTFAAHGLTVVRTQPVGVDEPLAPESHILYVLDVPAA